MADTVGDFEGAAVVAYLGGRDAESIDAWQKAYAECVRLGQHDRGARCAFWLGFVLFLRGDMAQGSGWLARAERLVEAAGGECAAQGFLLIPPFLHALGSDPATAGRLAGEMLEIARRCGDRDLMAFGLLSSGEAALAQADLGRGMKLLDEVMVSVTTGEVSPIPSGIIYCAVIEACMNVFDLRRAAEWTEALQAWCGPEPDRVPFRGQCLVHRSQVLQAHGEWSEAVTEAERARRHLSAPVHPALGLALYQQGELHRLRGEFAEAETAYRAASEQGREPVPGFALLRLAEGRVEAAVAAVRSMAEGSGPHPSRAAILAAAVEVLLAADDIAAARSASEELAQIAVAVDVPLLQAMAGYAAGAVHLAEGAPQAALARLRPACKEWRELAMPYDAARSRVLIGLACRALGDDDNAELELDAARGTFERIGAQPDLARVVKLTERAEQRSPAALTSRECEVLRLVATGRTNRQIAAELVVSEHTVARHLQNIFTKLGLSSRAAATAYAYEHGLV
ncbi:MAG TPA: response regulator transcription factor [Acidimicrobiia bacterium]|nr:response regulator transcription factor [Acidimicrobiia bacterium]